MKPRIAMNAHLLSRSTVSRTLTALFITLLLAIAPATEIVTAQPAARSVLVKVSPLAQQKMNIVASKRGISTGVASLDDLNRENGVVRMEPVFRDAGKFEARHRAFGLDRWYKVVYSIRSDEVEILEKYRRNSSIEDVALNHKRRLFHGTRSAIVASERALAARALAPNDPSFSSQWQYNNTGQTGGTADADIDLSEAWELSTGSTSVIVSVLDSGADLNHPDLEANIWTNPGEIAGNGIDDDQNGFVDDVHGWDFSDNDNNPDDQDGHGSHTAGTIAAATNNGTGVAGVAGGFGGSGVQVMPLKIFENAVDNIIAEAFVYAADNGAVISSNSWGGGGTSTIIENAIDYFIANAGGSSAPVQGGIVVFAAGNEGINSASGGYPASYAPVIAVSASDHTDRLPDWSNYGSWVDITAPGVAIVSTINNGGYDSFDGTSMATPHVAGVAALVASYAPGLTAAELRAALENSADNIDSLNPSRVGQLGSGRLNAHNAMMSTVPPPPDNTPPGRIANLSVGTRGATSLTLVWTATGDDGFDGRASSYDIRLLSSAGADPAAAPSVAGAPSPSSSGTSESFSVSGLSSSSNYFFALRAIDEAGNQGGFSNVATGRTIEPPSITLSPGEVSVSLEGGESTTETLTLTNTGGSSVTVSLFITAPATPAFEGSTQPASVSAYSFPASLIRLRTPEKIRKKDLKRDSRSRRSSIVRLSGGNVLVWDADGLSGTGENFDTILTGLGYQVDFTSALAAAGGLSGYRAVFISLGTYPNNHVLDAFESNELAAYLDGGGSLYMEGGDTWAWDPLQSVHGYFGISGVDDGTNDLDRVSGVSGTMAAGMTIGYRTDFDYGDYIDRLQATGSAEVVLQNADEGYAIGISHDAGSYKTFGASFALGAASSDGSSVSDVVGAIASFLIGNESSTSGPWLTTPTEQVTLSSGSSTSITLNISAAGLLAGAYTSQLKAHIQSEEVSFDKEVNVTLKVLSDDPTGGGDGGGGNDGGDGGDGGGSDPAPQTFPESPQAHFLGSATGYFDGDFVDQWSDESGNGHDASQGDYMSQPFFVEIGPGGEAGMLFDGISYLAIPNNSDMNTSGPYSEKTVALVFETGFDVSSRQVIFEEGGATRGLSIYLYSGNLYLNAWNLKRDQGNAPWGPVFVSTGVSSFNTYYVSMTLDASAGSVSGRVNGSAIGTASGAGLLFRHTGRIGLGSMFNGSRFHDRQSGGTGFGFEGVVSEFLYYGRVLSTSEQAGLEGYFESKYSGSSSSAITSGDESRAGIESLDRKINPSEFVLEPNYPNPFNPTTNFEYQIPEASSVRVVIYNTLGQVVRVVVDRHQSAGKYTVQWDGQDNAGISVASGTYLYRIQAGQLTQTRTMLLLK